jgi:hypothetical protein
VKAISRFIVKVADLAEAEGRVLRREAIAIGLLLVTALGALFLALAGFAMVVVSVFLALRPEIGAAWSAAVCALLLFGAAGGFVWLVKYGRDR